jgi:7-carboxy-7-deazaguanine synthase
VALLSKHPTPAEVLFSPVFEAVEPMQLAQWILDGQLNVRLQVQLHKLLWGDEKGRLNCLKDRRK